jgi:transglutaminase-like putative cysteine protease
VLIAAILVITPFLFFALPRVSAGRLSQFAQQNAFTTGFGDEVTLGQIGQIQQSDSVVMRAQFDHNPPADLKWHGTTLMNFDGRRWFNRRSDERTLLFRGSIDNTVNLVQPQVRLILDGIPSDLRRADGVRNGTARYLSYRVNLEPIGANLFFYPSRLLSIRGAASRDYLLSSNAVLTYRDEVANVVRSYSGVSIIENSPSETSSEPMDARMISYLELPAMDRRVSDLAQKITADRRTPYGKAEALETYLRANFGYTLEMQAAADPIPFFLFERKKGHCEYFASAMAVMLRTVGIPSRIVNGFRNGERSDVTGSYLIRARDAHSWVEAFIPGHGWVEFDPTPSGDPPQKTFWSRVNLYVDAAREFWADWVINYDFGHQNVLAELTTNNVRSTVSAAWRAMNRKYWSVIFSLQDWLSRGTQAPTYTVFPGNLALAISGLVISFAALGVWFRRRARRLARLAPESVASLWLQRLLKRMARRGLSKPPAQTASSWASSVNHDPLRAKLQHFVQEYEKARFGTSQESADRLADLYDEVEEVLKR